MATKYIINNTTEQTIIGGLKISGSTTILTTPPTSLSGTTSDKKGMIAFDDNYLYYCTSNFVAGVLTIDGGTPTHIFDADPGSAWDTYGGNYLQTGPPQEGGLTPLAGWYMVDDSGTIRQVLSDPVWFSGGQPTPIQNGPGWFFVLDGPYAYSVNNPTITFYETLPTVTAVESSGDIWKTTKLDETLNTTGTYRALLTQTATITGYNLNDFYNGLIIGETYTIDTFQLGDDFSNIANVQSGIINESGCVFIATGEVPKVWSNGSYLISNGNLVVDVLENSLGFPISWAYNGPWGTGVYIGVNDNSGPLTNTFPRNSVEVRTQPTQSFDFYPSVLSVNSQPASFMGKDDVIAVSVWDMDIWEPTYNRLYYMPVEIKINFNKTPIQVYGTIDNVFPFTYTSFVLKCRGNDVEFFYSNSPISVNNITELLDVLNTNNNLNTLGVFTEDGQGGIILTTTIDKKQQYCEDDTLIFNVFSNS